MRVNGKAAVRNVVCHRTLHSQAKAGRDLLGDFKPVSGTHVAPKCGVRGGRDAAAYETDGPVVEKSAVLHCLLGGGCCRADEAGNQKRKNLFHVVKN